MKNIFCALMAITSLCFAQIGCCPSDDTQQIFVGERISVQLPGDPELWYLDVETSKPTGHFFQIWSKDNEGIILVTSPLVAEDADVCLEDIVQTITTASGVHWEIYEASEREIILITQDENGTCMMRCLMTPSAAHFVSYAYKGSEAIDITHWVTWLREAIVVC